MLKSTHFATSAKINQSETLYLSFFWSLSQNSASQLVVDEVVNHTTHNLLYLSLKESVILLTVTLISLIIGNLFRFLLFKKVCDDNGFKKPINVMTGIIFAWFNFELKLFISTI